MTTLLWPIEALRPRSINASPIPRNLSAGENLNGIEQVMLTDTGFWTVILNQIQVRTSDQEKLWRYLSTQLKGRALPICVPLGVSRTAPWPLDSAGVPLPRTATFDDDTLFDDDTEWAQTGIVATMRAASLGATTVVIDLIDGADIEVGQVFGIGGTRAHEIGPVSKAGSAYTCSIMPPLRAAVSAGTEVDFNDPRVVCTLDVDAAMMLSFDQARHAEATLRFKEFK